MKAAWVLSFLAAPALGCTIELALSPLRATPDVRDKARVAGVELGDATGNVVAAFGKGRLFHLFYNDAVVRGAGTGTKFVIQRARRTVREFRSDHDPKPKVSVEYMVEVFKLKDGRLKRTDRHHGLFPLRKFHRREITKDLEIGCGEIPGAAPAGPWPFAKNKLYVQLQPYGPDRALYERVVFRGSTRWSTFASVAAGGRIALRVPALGIAIER